MSTPMDREASLTRPTGLTEEPEAGPGGPSSRLTFGDASQAQILRASQRDTAQIHGLIGLTSELLRSIAGTRWLDHRQSIVNLAVRAVYLVLTFGRGAQTLGEEYVDMVPYRASARRVPSRRRRLLTVLFLLLPSILTSKAVAARLRESTDDESSSWTTVRTKLASFIESPLGQALPEVHMAAFMFGGRFFEFGKRLTGISYISTLPPKPPGQEPPSYEPLGLLILLPVLFRLWPQRRVNEAEVADPAGALTESLGLDTDDTLVSNKNSAYDEPNTYLDEEARHLPERQCTLCLEPRGTGQGSGGTVAVTECGHVFCWGCLGGLEKRECPLCRQSLRMERLIAAYNL